MFVTMEDTSCVRSGDTLYFMSDTAYTNKLWWGAAVRVVEVEGEHHVKGIVPDRSFLKRHGIDSWNQTIESDVSDSDIVEAHVEFGIRIDRLLRFVPDMGESEELNIMFDEFVFDEGVVL